MAVTVTGDSGMGATVSIYFDKLGLERLLANVVMYPLTTKKVIPKGEGKVVQFHRYYNLSNTVSAASLTEGKLRCIAFYKSFLNILESLRIFDLAVGI